MFSVLLEGALVGHAHPHKGAAAIPIQVQADDACAVELGPLAGGMLKTFKRPDQARFSAASKHQKSEGKTQPAHVFTHYGRAAGL